MDLAWAILSALAMLVFFAGATWYEARRTRKDVDKIIDKIEPIPAIQATLDSHSNWLAGHETRIQHVEMRPIHVD